MSAPDLSPEERAIVDRFEAAGDPYADEPVERSQTAVQREQEWLRDLVDAPRLPLLGCSTVAHDRLDFCSNCVRTLVDGWPDGDRAEVLGWRLLALGQDEVAPDDATGGAA